MLRVAYSIKFKSFNDRDFEKRTWLRCERRILGNVILAEKVSEWGAFTSMDIFLGY